MIGNISCGGSFGAETKYEMNLKKGQAAKYDVRQSEVEANNIDEIRKAEIKVNQFDNSLNKIVGSTRNEKKITEIAVARENENQSVTDKRFLVLKSPSSPTPSDISDNLKRGLDADEKIDKVISAARILKEKVDDYADGERHRIIASNLTGETADELANQFKAIANQNPKISKPAVKISISASKNDNVAVEQWREIGKGALKELGYENCPFIIIQHRDREHDHIHILTSKVNIFGQTVKDSGSKLKLETFIRAVEDKYGFEKTQSSWETLRTAPKRGELERFQKNGEISIKMRLQTKVDYAIYGSQSNVNQQASLKISAHQFINNLEKAGVLSVPRFDEKGNVTGMSFGYDGKVMKGSSLGRGFSWGKLEDRGLDYQPDRDNQFLLKVKEKSEIRLKEWKDKKTQEIKQTQRINQITNSVLIEKQPSVSATSIAAKNTETVVIENVPSEVIKPVNTRVTDQTASINYPAKPFSRNNPDIKATSVKSPIVDESAQSSIRKSETLNSEGAPANVENQLMPEISRKDVNYSRQNSEINANVSSDSTQTLVSPNVDRQTKKNDFTQFFIPDGEKQADLPSDLTSFSANFTGENSAGFDNRTAIFEEPSKPDYLDSFSSAKTRIPYDYDRSNKYFREQESERIISQIQAGQKEFCESLTEQTQQMMETQSQVISQTQEQHEEQHIQFQKQTDALESLNKMIFQTDCDLKSYQELDSDSGSAMPVKILTIEPPDIMRIEDSVDFNAEIEPEAISVDQDSQSALIDDDMEDYEDDCEDDLEMSRGQKRVLSIF